LLDAKVINLENWNVLADLTSMKILLQQVDYKKSDLCGLLTGAFMSIGFASERLIKNEEERALWARAKTNEFWEWWEERAPRHCNELRSVYASDDKEVHSQNFNNMCQRITLKLDEMFVKEA
jgi:hypothetical protein